MLCANGKEPRVRVPGLKSRHTSWLGGAAPSPPAFHHCHVHAFVHSVGALSPFWHLPSV